MSSGLNVVYFVTWQRQKISLYCRESWTCQISVSEVSSFVGNPVSRETYK